MMTVAGAGATVPEFGPLLPALVAPTAPTPPFEPQLAPVRLALATTLIEAAATSRGAHLGGDFARARTALARERWEAAWETARLAAAAAVVEAARARLQYAAATARMPRRRAARELPSPTTVAETARRLGRDATPLFMQLDQLEKTAASSDTASSELSGWLREVQRTARTLDEAWRQLESAAAEDTAAWAQAAARVTAWRPSPWPFRGAIAVIIAVCLTAGLMLGGWIDIPPPLRPIADRIWGLR